MKEYTYKEMKEVLSAHGFHKIRGYIGYSKVGYFAVPMPLLILSEKFYGLFSAKFRKKTRANSLIFNLFGMKIIAEKKS